jgi:hypothetical protein
MALESQPEYGPSGDPNAGSQQYIEKLMKLLAGLTAVGPATMVPDSLAKKQEAYDEADSERLQRLAEWMDSVIPFPQALRESFPKKRTIAECKKAFADAIMSILDRISRTPPHDPLGDSPASEAPLLPESSRLFSLPSAIQLNELINRYEATGVSGSTIMAVAHAHKEVKAVRITNRNRLNAQRKPGKSRSDASATPGDSSQN